MKTEKLFCKPPWGIVLLISLLVFGNRTYCQEVSPVVIEVPDHKTFGSDFDSFILEHSFLALETSPECVMPGGGGHVYFHEDRILILYVRGGLFYFTRKGEFLSHVKPLGKGPLECVNMAALSIYNDEVFVLDFQGGKIVVFDLNGKPLREFATPMYPYDIIHNDKGELLLYIKKEAFDGKPYELIKYNESSGKFSGYMPASHFNKAMTNGWNTLEGTPYGPFLGYPGCDTIFSLSGDYAIPAYILDYGKIGLKDNLKASFSMIKLQNTKKRFMTYWHGWRRVGNIVSFLYYTNDRIDNILFHDLTKDRFYGDKWDYPDFELGRIYSPTGVTKDSFVFVVQAIKILEEAEEHPDRCSPALLRIAQNLEPEDNPVLMFWRVK